jgi:hypothetical protein
VRFAIHPVPDREDLNSVQLLVLDRREVTSSNGETEMRYVIENHAGRRNGNSWPIEVTLIHRGGMFQPYVVKPARGCATMSSLCSSECFAAPNACLMCIHKRIKSLIPKTARCAFVCCRANPTAIPPNASSMRAKNAATPSKLDTTALLHGDQRLGARNSLHMTATPAPL